MNDGNLLGQILLQLALIFINAIFACAEIAIISINDAKLNKLSAAGNKKAVTLTKLTGQPARFLSTIQVGITLAGFIGSAFAADNFSGYLTDLFLSWGSKIPLATLDTIATLVITLILSYITLVLGELVPKRIAMRNAEKLALGLSGLIYGISKIFAPVVWLLTISTNGILRLFGIDPNAEEEHVTEEEIRMMLDEGSEKGTIMPDEKDMIHNIFEFDDKTAAEAMTHRTDVTLLWQDDTDEQWEEAIFEGRHSIYPVCGESADDVLGVLHVKDYIGLKNKSREEVLKYAVRPAYFVPETVKTDILFRNMKKSRNHFAIVLDEYGGMSGIVTMSDLLEELVGDLDDDVTMPLEPPDIEQIDTNTWRIQGWTPLDEVSDALSVPLPEEDYDTFGGLVFGILGAIPEDGSTPQLEEYGMAIKVLEIKEHRLESALVSLIDAAKKEGAAEQE